MGKMWCKSSEQSKQGFVSPTKIHRNLECWEASIFYYCVGIQKNDYGADLDKFQDIITLIGLSQDHIVENVELHGSRDKNTPNRTYPKKVTLEKKSN